MVKRRIPDRSTEAYPTTKTENRLGKQRSCSLPFRYLNALFSDKSLSESYGKFTVKTLNETSSQDYTLREFVVAKEGHPEDRKIYHFHFQVHITKFLLIHIQLRSSLSSIHVLLFFTACSIFFLYLDDVMHANPWISEVSGDV